MYNLPGEQSQPISKPYEKSLGVKVIQNEHGDNKFVIKDSGQRETFSGGMVRDTSEGKTDYSLVMDGPMFLRWAQHLTNGAKKYAKRNWMLARGGAEHTRFKESALRHFIQWYNNETDEDHAAAVFFNINGAEYVMSQSDKPYVALDAEAPKLDQAGNIYSDPQGYNI